MRTVMAMVLMLGACAETKSEVRGGAAEPPASENGAQAGAVTPEQMEEIESMFRRKEPAVSQCYSEEMERDPSKKFEGNIELNMVITPGGRATDIKVIKSSLNNPNVEQCVAKLIGTWQFPQVSAKYAVTHRYGFKRSF